MMNSVRVNGVMNSGRVKRVNKVFCAECFLYDTSNRVFSSKIICFLPQLVALFLTNL